MSVAKLGDRFKCSLCMVTACSFLHSIKLSNGRLRNVRSTINISTRLDSRPFSHPVARRSTPLLRSINRTTRNGAKKRLGNDGNWLFSNISSSIGLSMNFATDLMPFRTRGKSLCEHLCARTPCGDKMENKLIINNRYRCSVPATVHHTGTIPITEIDLPNEFGRWTHQIWISFVFCAHRHGKMSSCGGHSDSSTAFCGSVPPSRHTIAKSFSRNSMFQFILRFVFISVATENENHIFWAAVHSFIGETGWNVENKMDHLMTISGVLNISLNLQKQ